MNRICSTATKAARQHLAGLAAATALIISAQHAFPAAADSKAATQVEEDQRRVMEAYGKLPISFEDNLGQTDQQVKYLARLPGATVYLTPAAAVLDLHSAAGRSANPAEPPSKQTASRAAGHAVVRMTFP